MQDKIPELARMLGRWQMVRRVLDAAGAETALLRGEAVIAGDARAAIYDETGTLSLPGQPPIRATRRYLWDQGPEGIVIRFDDGRAFHAIGASRVARHYCDPDIYDVDYDFALPGRWRSVWRVRGPRKDYTMMTEYSRL